VLSSQLFFETMRNERAFDIALDWRSVGKCQVRVASEHRLVLQLVGPWVEAVDAMSPSADEYEVCAPRGERLKQLCEGVEVVHLVSVADD
jgi:hypothetical protein